MENEQTGLTPQKERYSPKQTQQIRKAAVQDILLAQTDLLQKSDTKVNLRDTAEVKRITVEFMRICSDVGILPTVEGLCARLGLSRACVYKYIRENSEDETAQYLNQVRLMWAHARMGLAERGLADTAMSIFILKNSEIGFADKHDFQVDVQEKQDRPDWAIGLNDGEYARKLVESVSYLQDGEE